MLKFFKEDPKLKNARKFTFVCETAEPFEGTKLLIETIIVYVKDRFTPRSEITKILMKIKEDMRAEFKLYDVSFANYLQNNNKTLQELKKLYPHVKLDKSLFVYEESSTVQ